MYLIQRRDGYLLVDTAIGTNDAFAALDRGLKDAGVTWREIRQIVVSHLHPDHAGLAPRLRTLSGAPVVMHRDDADLLDQVTAGPAKAEELRRELLAGGVEPSRAEAVTASYSRLTLAFPRFEPDAYLAEGDTVKSTLGDWRAMVTPGHAPGHLCLYNAEHGLLFTGDQVIEEITPHIAWLPGRDSLGEFLESMARLGRLPARMMLPSHGLPFSGLEAWTARTVKHHEDRCRQLEALLDGKGLTVAEMVGSIWKRQLPSLDYQLAFTEILSHLVYLECRGRVAVEGTPIRKWFRRSVP